jgi:hypothetical protein
MMASRDPDAAPFIPEINGYGQNVEEGQTIAPRELTPDEQDRVDSGVGSLGLDVDGPGTGGQWISSTTRHGASPSSPHSCLGQPAMDGGCYTWQH